jgi:chromosome segregation ATPase
LDEYIRGITARTERLEAETGRLARDLGRVVESRQAEQERARRELADAVDAVTRRLGDLPEVRAQIEGLSSTVRALEALAHDLTARQEEESRRLETTAARIESLDTRLAEQRGLLDGAAREVAGARTDLGRVTENLLSLREGQAQAASETRARFEAMRDALADPARRLDLLEEARRRDATAGDTIAAGIAALDLADQRLQASVEKLARAVAENEQVAAGELDHIRTEGADALAALRKRTEERGARQQADITAALAVAAQARSTADAVQEIAARLRSQLEQTVQQMILGERQRLERALDHATGDLRAYDERAGLDGPGPVR